MAGVQNTATHLQLIFNTGEKMHFTNARTYMVTFFWKQNLDAANMLLWEPQLVK